MKRVKLYSQNNGISQLSKQPNKVTRLFEQDTKLYLPSSQHPKILIIQIEIIW